MSSLFPTTEFTLPSFRRLLIQGPYHATAPLHLCLSHLAQTTSTRAVFLTPSRDALITALREFDEEWLNVHGGHGAISKLSSKVDILLVIAFLASDLLCQLDIHLAIHQVLPI